MYKFGLAFVSLIAAVPAAYLGCVLLTTVFGIEIPFIPAQGKWEEIPAKMQGLLAVTLGLCGIVALLPVGALLFTPTAPKEDAADDAAAGEDEIGSVKERIEAEKETQAADRERKEKRDAEEVDMDEFEDDEELADDDWTDKR